MPATSRLDICNQAVGEIAAHPIASVDETSLEARECRRFYPQVISEMLEGPHDWSFANRRVALAAVATNDREAEWSYAYALPADMASPIGIVPNLAALGFALPTLLEGQSYASIVQGFPAQYAVAYVIENGVLYTGAADASLEYVINDVSEVVLPKLVSRAIILDLASRLAMPVKKDRELKQGLEARAALAWERAMADDLNRSPRGRADYIPEAILARDGII